MSRSVTYKLRGQALEAALKFAADLNMDLNTAAERALLWAIRQAYTTYADKGTLEATQTDAAGNPQGTDGTADSSPTLAHTGPVDDPGLVPE